MRRREFVKLTVALAAQAPLVHEIVAGVGGRDEASLTAVQTSHETDLAIATLVDRPGIGQLHRWMDGGSERVLRVNATGILAKLPSQAATAAVEKTLAGDTEVRELYLTAVLSRAGELTWATAARLAREPGETPSRLVPRLVSRLAVEERNPRDAGARWCSAVLLRELSPRLG